MTVLAAHQRRFMAGLLDDTQPPPPGWTARHEAGLAIYRNNYRTSLVEALSATFERTRRLVGEEAFRRAAIHHVILNPPAGWTLDTMGDGFEQTCAQLFPDNPEVGHLAWLEWAMARAFVSHDAAALSAQEFAQICANAGDCEWENMQLCFVPNLASVAVSHDVPALWSSLSAESVVPTVATLEKPHHILVWRDGERPVFILQTETEARTLAVLADGAGWGNACAGLGELLGEDAAAAEAGRMLGSWVKLGIVCDVRFG